MPSKNALILLTSLAFAACAVETIDPPVPKGTVFAGEAAEYGDAATNSAGECGTNCNGGQTVAAGYHASLQKGSDIIALESGSTVPAFSTAGIVTYSPTIFDGDRFYNFSYGFPAAIGQYGVVAMQSWFGGADLTKAGFQYSETQTGATPKNSSSVAGTLSVLSVTSDRVVAVFNGSATVDGQNIPIESSFNVPVEEQ